MTLLDNISMMSPSFSSATVLFFIYLQKVTFLTSRYRRVRPSACNCRLLSESHFSCSSLLVSLNRLSVGYAVGLKSPATSRGLGNRG